MGHNRCNIINEIHGVVNDKLKLWRHIIESKGFKLKKTKTELKCKFSDIMHEAGMELNTDTQIILKKENFMYHSSIIKRNEKICDNVAH